MRTRIMNQLQALAMNEGYRWKKKQFSEQGRAQLEKLTLAPWASRRRQELLELLDRILTDSGVKAFVPYTLRHPALTNLGEQAGGDVFVLARIAGHSSITVTQRYIHPQADAINRVFAASQSQVGTKLGTAKRTPKRERSKVLAGRKVIA